MLRRTNGKDMVLANQFGGSSRSGLPPGGDWRCLAVSGIRNARLRDGPWREGTRHDKAQTCVETVDVDINVHVRRLRR